METEVGRWSSRTPLYSRWLTSSPCWFASSEVEFEFLEYPELDYKSWHSQSKACVLSYFIHVIYCRLVHFLLKFNLRLISSMASLFYMTFRMFRLLLKTLVEAIHRNFYIIHFYYLSHSRLVDLLHYDTFFMYWIRIRLSRL